MFPCAGIEDLKNYYRGEGACPFEGIWSILITSSVRDSRDFADRYAEIFNDIVRNDWHLAICSRQDERRNWIEAPDLQEICDLVRQCVRAEGRRKLSKNGILFFDPATVSFARNGVAKQGFNDGRFVETCVFWPLKMTKIGDSQYFPNNFSRVHEVIRVAMEVKELDAQTVVSKRRVSEILMKIQGELLAQELKPILASFGMIGGKFLWDYISNKISGGGVA